MEELRPRHGDLHRPLQDARAHRSQRRLEIVRQLAAKATADVAGDDAHIRLGDVECAGEALLWACGQLRRRVHRQLRAVPHGHGRMRLHRRLMLIGRGVGRVDLHRGIGEGTIEIADRTVGRIAAADAARIDGGRTGRVQIITARHGRIADADHRGSRSGLLERICDDEGDGKTEIRYVIVIEGRDGARKAVRQIDRAKRVLRRRIIFGENQPYSRRPLCIPHIYGSYAALGDGGGNDDAIEGGTLRRVLVGIGRLARDFQAAIDAIEGKADRI